jgi:phospholipid/cholesterol/gamma-HCH transport system ATP-binding protein
MSFNARTEPALEVDPLGLDGVITELGGRRILDGVTLPVEAGKITALVGPSGVGKTLCVRHLTGLLAPTAGRVMMDGRDMTTLTRQELREHRRQMGVLFQGSSAQGAGLFGSLSVLDNLRFVLRSQTDLSDEEIMERARIQVEQVGLAQFADAFPQTLSTGMARRAALARALVTEPRMLLLDDLDSGIDDIRLSLLADLVRQAQADTGMTVLVTTHDPELVDELADTVAVLRSGRIRSIGPPHEVLAKGGRGGGTFLAGDRTAGLEMAPEPVGPATLTEVNHQPVGVEGRQLPAALLGFFIMVAIAATWFYVAANHTPG